LARLAQSTFILLSPAFAASSQARRSMWIFIFGQSGFPLFYSRFEQLNLMSLLFNQLHELPDRFPFVHTPFERILL
jgi:hypothetical protein